MKTHNKNKRIVIKLTNVSKKYFTSKNKDDFIALNNINLTIYSGERLGIIGDNGSGKSTLLKILSGISKPTSGDISSNGKIVSLMKLEAGFNPELTGEENIYLNGMLVGMTKEEIDKKYKWITDFSEISDFIKMPLYTYSDGMKFRLALSVALSSRCDILIIDEILISGDIKFQKKTIEAIRKAQDSQNIVTIMTSHIPSFVWAFSNSFYKLEHGNLTKLTYKQMEKIAKSTDHKWRNTLFKK